MRRRFESDAVSRGEPSPGPCPAVIATGPNSAREQRVAVGDEPTVQLPAQVGETAVEAVQDDLPTRQT
jgi:hypothetical protein